MELFYKRSLHSKDVEDIVELIFKKYKEFYYYIEDQNRIELGRFKEQSPESIIKDVLGFGTVRLFNKEFELKSRRRSDKYHVVVADNSGFEELENLLDGPLHLKRVENKVNMEKYKYAYDRMLLWGQYDEYLMKRKPEFLSDKEYKNIFYEAKIPSLLNYPVKIDSVQESSNEIIKACIEYEAYTETQTCFLNGQYIFKYSSVEIY